MSRLEPLLAFGAHPDDVEFGCGGILARESRAGRPVHIVVCSLGEAGTHGTPDERKSSAEKAAEIIGATVEFADFGGDAHFERNVDNRIRLAEIIRRVKPTIVLAPTLVANQHPDHAALGEMVRDAARLARYGGVHELREQPAHAIGQLFYYAITPQAEPTDITPVIVDVSEDLETWTRAMQAHASQIAAREYVDLSLARARMRGLSAGVGHAIALYPNDPVVLDGLSAITRGARRF